MIFRRNKLTVDEIEAYIQNHLDESTFYGGINEARQMDFDAIPDYTYEQMIERLRKNLSETSKNN